MKKLFSIAILVYTVSLKSMESNSNTKRDIVIYNKEVNTIFAWRKKSSDGIILQLSKNMITDNINKHSWQNGNDVTPAQFQDDFKELKDLIKKEEKKLKS